MELVYGVVSNSLAVLADAGHNFGDVLGLLLAWGATIFATRAPPRKFTYGLRGTTILAALGNAMLLLVAVGAIAWEALRQLAEPAPVEGGIVVWVALIGVRVGIATMPLRHRLSKAQSLDASDGAPLQQQHSRAVAQSAYRSPSAARDGAFAGLIGRPSTWRPFRPGNARPGCRTERSCLA